MSYLAEFLLRKAYEKKAPQQADAAVQTWRDATLLDDEEYVRAFAKLRLETINVVKNLGVEVPIWLPFELRRAVRKAEMERSSKKRQRGATASDPKALNGILATLPLRADFTFRPPAEFVPPTYELLKEAAETLSRSLFTDHVLAPEQPPREFLAECKRLLRQMSYFSEVKIPTRGPLKRADAMAAVGDSPRGIIELKKKLTSIHTPAFERALAQIAVYVAAGYFDLSPVPFVLLTGDKGPSSANFTAISGICLVQKDYTGDLFVKEIHHEKKFVEVVFSACPEGIHFVSDAFSAILRRISALGEEFSECSANEDGDEDEEDDYSGGPEQYDYNGGPEQYDYNGEPEQDNHNEGSEDQEDDSFDSGNEF